MAGAAEDAAGGAHDPPSLAAGDEEGRTAASTAVHASTNPNTVKLFALPLLRSGARGICRHAHCVLIFAHERQR
jgi:hypothetical protein